MRGRRLYGSKVLQERIHAATVVCPGAGPCGAFRPAAKFFRGGDPIVSGVIS
jgi:hypothetical protein